MKVSSITSISHAPLGIDWLDTMVEKDQTRVYYPFLYRLAQQLKPKVIVELGVQTGRSTAHLAAGAPDARVLGIDIEFWDMQDILDRCPNIELVEGTSQEVIHALNFPHPIDLLFIDSDHSYEQVKLEWELYGPLVRKGGIVLVDDIDEPTWPGVRQAWLEMEGRKIELPGLHMSGFGVLVKR